MRYDQTIYFCKNPKMIYSETTGDYIESTETDDETTDNTEKVPLKTECFAAITNASAEMQNVVYGKLKDGSLSVQLRQHYDAPFDYIEIGGKRYGVDSERRLRTKHTFIVSEV